MHGRTSSVSCRQLVPEMWSSSVLAVSATTQQEQQHTAGPSTPLSTGCLHQQLCFQQECSSYMQNRAADLSTTRSQPCSVRRLKQAWRQYQAARREMQVRRRAAQKICAAVLEWAARPGGPLARVAQRRCAPSTHSLPLWSIGSQQLRTWLAGHTLACRTCPALCPLPSAADQPRHCRTSPACHETLLAVVQVPGGAAGTEPQAAGSPAAPEAQAGGPASLRAELAVPPAARAEEAVQAARGGLLPTRQVQSPVRQLLAAGAEEPAARGGR